MSQAARREGVEIRVHTTAPSRGTDDVKYRELTAAYLDFVPVARVVLSQDDTTSDSVGYLAYRQQLSQPGVLRTGGDHGIPNMSEAPSSQSQYRARGKPGAAHVVAGPSRGATRNLQAGSPQLSFEDILDNRDSPLLRRLPGTIRSSHSAEMPAEELGNSWHTPPSEVLDSQSTFDKAIPELSSPTRVLKLYLQGLPTIDREDKQQVSMSRRTGAASKPVDAHQRDHTASQNNGTVDVTSDIIAASSSELSREAASQPPSTRPNGSVAKSARSSSEHVNTVEEAPVLLDSPSRILNTPDRPAEESTTGTDTAPGNTLLPKGHSVSHDLLARPASPPLPHIATAPQHAPRSRTSNGNVIEPPIPPTNCITTSLEDHILTPGLTKILESFQVMERPDRPWYLPQSQTRPLDSIERGYWVVPTAQWPEDVRNKAWKLLKDYIACGSAGWGVRAVRDYDSHNEKERSGEWRVYCWGGVVEPIWLMLYLTSAKQIKKIGGARWIDGDGKCVIVMA